MSRVLVIDDDLPIAESIKAVVGRLGHGVETAQTLAEGRDKALHGDFDVVFLDVRLPDGNGLDAIADVRRAESAPEVIVLTGWGDAEGAEMAMRRGAWDYIEKPPTLRSIGDPLMRALKHRASRLDRLNKPLVFHGIAGASPERKRCLEEAALAAVGDAPVLLGGETGTGKELLARAIHDSSRRAKGPFVVVDCAALPESIIESVLFGAAKGAFTGADRPREGLIVHAHGGTLFLDEVGELPLNAQRAFLRVLQEHVVRPVGATVERVADFRLVAATHRDLDELVERGLFRGDLLFRLRGVTMELPPLRSHSPDILEFAVGFVESAAKRLGFVQPGLSNEFVRALLAYPWPGNIRELKHTVDAALAQCGGGERLEPHHLPMRLRVAAARDRLNSRQKLGAQAAAPEPPAASVQAASVQAAPSFAASAATVLPTPPTPAGPVAFFEDGDLPDFRRFKQRLESQYLERLILQAEGDAAKALDISGLSRSRLYSLLKEHGLKLRGA